MSFHTLWVDYRPLVNATSIGASRLEAAFQITIGVIQFRKTRFEREYLLTEAGKGRISRYGKNLYALSLWKLKRGKGSNLTFDTLPILFFEEKVKIAYFETNVNCKA